ncbi:magnesium transporter MgtE N-terminal domain-containing protein, partial [Thermogutta sp.]|uniref:magnesium transporter MgtE N-terminal domain-containing protein n=1 Tax=Thermogutta sp. TaxID=1962930 RepID=UPI003C7A0254
MQIEELACELQKAIEQKDVGLVTRIVQKIPPGELPHILWQLGLEDQTRLMELIDSEEAAELLLELPESQAADVLEAMDGVRAAAILDQMPSNEQADLLGAVAAERSEEFLKQMMPGEAEDARRLLQYRPDTAGGLMITEYLAYEESLAVDDVIQDLRENADKYRKYDVL